MAIEFTADQKRAIESRDCSLIVSAAAGSGKTAVLVERVIGLLTDPQSPVDIDRLLVVTFTKAAAAEMRSRIGKALLERIAQQPGDMRLRRQLSLLPGARIQTVHSFCLDLVREHFALCGVPADFGLLDDGRAQELRAQALDEALDELYEENDGDFAALCQALDDEKGDRTLCEVLENIRDHLTTHPDPAKTLENFTSPDGQDGWKSYLLDRAREQLDEAQKRLANAAALMEDVPYVKDRYGPAFEASLSFAERAREAIRRGWAAAYDVFHTFEQPAISSVRGKEYKELAERLKSERNEFNWTIGQIRDKLIFIDEPQSAFGREQNIAALRGLRLAVTRYEETYWQLKLKRRMLDFSDLEHKALALLQTPDGEPTVLGAEVSENIEELLVDEYQDTNLIQEAIFNAVSCRSRASFFVGDVKQSIYRFRMAEPRLFLERYDRYAPFEDGAKGKAMRLPLNVNYRSRGEVLTACNHVFRTIMSREFGDVDYNDSESLHQGAPYEGECPVTFEIIDMQGAGDDEDSPERTEAEAILTANHIEDLLATAYVTDPFTKASRRAEPSDCAILLSSFAGKSGIFIRELDRLGIPAGGGRRAFWHSLEVMSVMSFLRVLDNRRQDIPLVGLLRSPFFLFTADELAAIRLEDKSVPLFDALTLHAAHDDKSRRFLEALDRYISFVPDVSPSQLIGMIYAETSAEAVFAAMDGGDSRVLNLRRLQDLAAGFESGTQRSLFDFIRYAEQMMENDSVPVDDEGGGVRVMSIHGSKGLEFPFVFLPDLYKKFNFDDTIKHVVMHDRLGVGLKLKLPALHASFRTPMHHAVAEAIKRELAAEEERKLYVSMTRARERLFLLASKKDAPKAIESIRQHVTLNGITPTWLSTRQNAAEWLIAALEHERCEAIRFSVIPYTAVARRERIGRVTTPKSERPAPDPELLRLLARSGEPYPYATLAALPSKLTPAGTRRLLEDAGIIDSTPDGRVFVNTTPRDGSMLRSGLTAAQRGSAVHLFLQKADLVSCVDADSVRRQLEALVSDDLLTQEEAQAIDTSMILGFTRSRWGQGLRTHRYEREYEFSALFSPAELRLGKSDEREILMNGVIDLLLFGPDGLTILDFKTDSINSGEESRAAERHRLQVEIYAAAAERIFGKPVKEKVVFFLNTGEGATL